MKEFKLTVACVDHGHLEVRSTESIRQTVGLGVL